MGETSGVYERITSIRDDKMSKENLTAEDVLNLIRQGKILDARQSLVFHTAPSLFVKKTYTVTGVLERDFNQADAKTKKSFLNFLTKYTIDLTSFLPQWNLKNKKIHGKAALSNADIETVIVRNKEIISLWFDQEKALADSLLEDWLDEVALRFMVEGVNDGEEAKKQAAKFVGSSILNYMKNLENSFRKSNLRLICELQTSGQTKTKIGNDHSTNLEYAMWLGAPFVTTNPQLVEIALELEPEIWIPRVDKLICNRYSLEELNGMMGENRQKLSEAIERINTDITMEVVLENAIMLRGIFLLSQGQTGLVCLQVNPLKHSDANAMIQEALDIYPKLTERLRGVPNVVFKLPATKDGFDAARFLTRRGIGVAITVSFGMFQALPFADVINKGKAISSYLVIMNGRLANPVMNELKELGEDYSRAERWAGIAVAKRLYQKLYAPTKDGGRNYDSDKIKMLVASLRNYEETFPDITELLGVPFITVFPDNRRAFDAEERNIDPNRIEKPIDDEILKRLLKSELFRQAYFVSDDNEEQRPTSPFSLEEREKVLKYPPVNNTPWQFCEYRVKTGEFVRNRILNLCSQLKQHLS